MIATLTKAQLRALIAVREGFVWHEFDAHGNSFKGPQGIGAQSFRRLEELNLIEDTRSGKYATRFKVRLTAAGADELLQRHVG